MQRSFIFAALFLVFFATPISSESDENQHEDQRSVIAAIRGYVEGTLTADGARVAGALHTRVNQVQVHRLPEGGGDYLSFMTHSGLVETAMGLSDRVDRLNSTVEVKVLDIGHDMATASARSAYRYEFVQLGLLEDRWKVINVLTAGSVPDSTGNPQAWGETEAEAIRRTALDYIDGSFSGDADRMARAVHPELNKILLAQGRQSGRPFLHRMGSSDLVEVTRAGFGTMEESERGIEVQIQAVWDDVAAARVVSSAYIDHLQLAKFNDEWKIVNVLWIPNPDADGTGSL